MIFDGQRILYSTFPNLDGRYEDPGRNGVIVVTVTFSREVDLEDGLSLLAIYNTAFRQAYHHLGLTNFRRKWLNEATGSDAGSFRIVQGFVPSIVSLAGGLSYIVDVATRIDRAGTLLDFLRRGVNDPGIRQDVKRAVSSLMLTTTIRPKPAQVNAGMPPFSGIARRTPSPFGASIANRTRNRRSASPITILWFITLRCRGTISSLSRRSASRRATL
jgi:hypothetical protein